MEICVITTQLKNVYSGIGLYSQILINELIEGGHTVTVITPVSQKLEKNENFQIFTVQDTKLIRSQARWIIYSLRFSEMIKKIEKRLTFDIIHFTDVRDSFFCNSKSIKIGNINDTYVSDLKKFSYYRKHYIDWFSRWVYYKFTHVIEQKKLPKLDGIIANSIFTQKSILSNYHLDQSNIFTCYKSVDIQKYNNVCLERQKKEGNLEEAVILFVGGNMQRKGIIDLIMAAPAVLEKHFNTKFIIVGGDKYIHKYKILCRKYKVEHKFFFLGWVPQANLLDIYRSATLFVMPSLIEAFGVVFLEAMAAGVPVIGTKVGGINEIIINENNGLIVPVNSSSQLADAIIKLIINPRLRKVFSNRGRQTVMRFSIDKMMKCTKDIYANYL